MTNGLAQTGVQKSPRPSVGLQSTQNVATNVLPSGKPFQISLSMANNHQQCLKNQRFEHGKHVYKRNGYSVQSNI